MPLENDGTLKYLEGREAAALAELRRLAPEALKEYLEVRAAISGLTAHTTAERSRDEYFGIRKPFQAVESYLRRTNKFEDPRVIAQALVDGGFARGEDTRPYWNVIDSIKHHTEESGRLIKKGDLVGLREWAPRK